jgi:hypothetical protein
MRQLLHLQHKYFQKQLHRQTTALLTQQELNP